MTHNFMHKADSEAYLDLGGDHTGMCLCKH